MPLKSWDGVYKTIVHIGLLLTHGTKDGETTDSSKLKEETTNVELKDKLLPVSQNLNLKSFRLNNDYLKPIELLIYIKKKKYYIIIYLL
jgi:hypothetical protein